MQHCVVMGQNENKKKKEENAGCQDFSSFSPMFSKASHSWVIKIQECLVHCEQLPPTNAINQGFSTLPFFSHISFSFIFLTLSQATNFRLFLTQRVCRQQFQI